MKSLPHQRVMTLGEFRDLTADLPDFVPLWAVVRSNEDPDGFEPSSPLYDADVCLWPRPVVVNLYVEGLA